MSEMDEVTMAIMALEDHNEECYSHDVTVLYQETRDGQLHVVIGCDSCGQYKEVKVSLKSELPETRIS